MERISLASVAAAFVTFAALSAHAATVTVTSSAYALLPGANITLEVHVTVSPADGADSSLFGALVFPTSGIAAPTPGTQNAFIPVAPGLPYALGTLTCTALRCVSFNQVAGVQGAQLGNVTDFVIAQQTYSILPGTLPGTVLTWSWQTSPTTQRLDFFGAVAQVPAVSVTVISAPEPATAALLALGLLGLAAARRRA